MTTRSNDQENAGKGPCAGLRVIEVATMVSGPFAGQMLGDLGAEVIKIETTAGDPMRGNHPMHEGMSAYFSLFNRNKKSICLDLKSDEGRTIAADLIAGADVVLENFRPGTMERLGLGYEALRQRNPRLIYAGLSGFGEDGPYKDKPAYDHVIQALSGAMPVMGSPEDPAPIPHIIADKVASILACNAIIAALLHRERAGGKGQKVSLSLMKAYAAFLMPDLLNNFLFQTKDVQKIPNIKIHHPLRLKDGSVMGHVQLDPQFKGLCRIFGREDLLEDKRYNTSWSRIFNYADFWKELEEPASKMTKAEVIALADEYGVPLAPVNSVEEFMADPQAVHTECFIDTEDPEFGRMRTSGFFADFEASPPSIRMRAPKLGEHTGEILKGLGRSDDDIEAARKSQAIK
ncbi:MAG: carnitine dehydratase [Alphaproteobacteria bacterium HGW-Alphaproteobacteria-18]|nr:MAG: carnitine dehydratase [Alphaproteobacteria bacterium HGW-Alphaproteobacteria-18]